MNIAQIKQLDVGMSGISCSGEVTWAGKPQNPKGTTDGRDYDFWSLFVVVGDKTDKIGVQLSAESEFAVPVGSFVNIEKAQLQSYEKDGKTNLKLVGKLAVKPQQPAPQDAQQGVLRPAGGSKDRLIVAQVVYKAFAETLYQKTPGEFDVWLMGNQFVLKRHVDLIMQIGAGEIPQTGKQMAQEFKDSMPPAQDNDIPY